MAAANAIPASAITTATVMSSKLTLAILMVLVATTTARVVTNDGAGARAAAAVAGDLTKNKEKLGACYDYCLAECIKANKYDWIAMAGCPVTCGLQCAVLSSTSVDGVAAPGDRTSVAGVVTNDGARARPAAGDLTGNNVIVEILENSNTKEKLGACYDYCLAECIKANKFDWKAMAGCPITCAANCAVNPPAVNLSLKEE